jgi:TnpA family transposase
VELRRRVHAGLNKARGAPIGEIRDRSFEQQRYRASGLNLVTAAIVLWNTVYLERATSALRAHGKRWTRCCNICPRWGGSIST